MLPKRCSRSTRTATVSSRRRNSVPRAVPVLSLDKPDSQCGPMRDARVPVSNQADRALVRRDRRPEARRAAGSRIRAVLRLLVVSCHCRLRPLLRASLRPLPVEHRSLRNSLAKQGLSSLRLTDDTIT